jgi:hypothetical protein
MNSILHNISILILGTGIIMIVIYITKVNNNSYVLPKQNGLIIKNSAENENVNDIYNEKTSDIFKSMFSQSSLIQDYQTLNINDKTDKLYIK